MPRKRITQVMPWLLPIRTKQRLLFFYLGMACDRNRYAAAVEKSYFPHALFQARSPLYNNSTGRDMVYQENKVFNLKLAARKLDKLVIGPGETFSFWQAVKDADRDVSYQKGLTVIDGELSTSSGGGLCQLSNLLFWVFLHSPLTIVERHGHGTREFPDSDPNWPAGVDATIAEGWLDLKVRNDTDIPCQIQITFDPENIICALLTKQESPCRYQVANGKPEYYSREGVVFEEVDIFQTAIPNDSGEWSSSRHLYHNHCKIGYPLPDGTRVIKKG